MAKQQAVRNHYKSGGYAQSGDAYNKDMRRAEQQDQAAAAQQAPVYRDPEIRAFYDKCEATCCGCCNDSEEDEEDSSCCIIM